LSEVVNLPSSLREINIEDCSKLRFISSGQLDALEVLVLYDCISLASLPSGPEPQEYSSLRWLTIRECPGIKSLPSALQQRLDSGLVADTQLDSRLEGTHQSFPYGTFLKSFFFFFAKTFLKSCVCMPPYIHVCPVVSNLNAYYVLIWTELADIYI
jgi:hypothetical protein